MENLRVLQPCVFGVNDSALVAFDQPRRMDYDVIELFIPKSTCDDTKRRKDFEKVCFFAQGN